MHEVFRRAIELAGGQMAVGAAIGVSQTTVSYQLNKRRRCPAEWVPELSRLSGIPKGELRPDLFGAADEAAA